MTRYANAPSGNGTSKKPKIFVLDTNIILHDYKAIRKFQENDVVVPIAVIEELDKFKKGTDALSFNARGFMREINKLTEGRMFGRSGVPLGGRLGNFKQPPSCPSSLQELSSRRDEEATHPQSSICLFRWPCPQPNIMHNQP